MEGESLTSEVVYNSQEPEWNLSGVFFRYNVSKPIFVEVNYPEKNIEILPSLDIITAMGEKNITRHIPRMCCSCQSGR